MSRIKALRLVSNADLDAYEAEQKARLELTTRYDIALQLGDELDLRRVEALIATHDYTHGTQLLTELTAA
ncbi:hypothetical protein [Streptomyces sp. NBC_01794]|uniref:hypothetical protein n=1 Tax=Streptomyces sp. NBC_01794 TaxID=2975942 RepID=UPI003092830F|nr:hypothetical protein OIE54_12100 [Streptomyces sp. NBC_01794]